MPQPDERQAKALEQIAHTNKEIVKVLSALNDNLVGAFKHIKAAIEKDEAEINERQQKLDLWREQMQAPPLHKPREEGGD